MISEAHSADRIAPTDIWHPVLESAIVERIIRGNLFYDLSFLVIYSDKRLIFRELIFSDFEHEDG